MKTIRLTDYDMSVLAGMMGTACGAYHRDKEEIPADVKEVVDWILLQSDRENYIYFHVNKKALREKKEAELEQE